jgi:hypothetical protein
MVHYYIRHSSLSTRSSYQEDNREKPWNFQGGEKNRALWAIGHHSPLHSVCFPNTSTIFAALSRSRRQRCQLRRLEHTGLCTDHIRMDTIRFPVHSWTHSGCYMQHPHLHWHQNTLLLSTQRSDVLRTAPSSQPTAITALEPVRLRNVKCSLRGKKWIRTTLCMYNLSAGFHC